MSTFPVSVCKSCGAQIIWALNPTTGKNVPLIARRTTGYALKIDEEAPLNHGQPQVVAVPHTDLVYVSHYLNCPNAGQHHKEASEKQTPDSDGRL
jgi:hypothetical protein